jgi:hypothetical protein
MVTVQLPLTSVPGPGFMNLPVSQQASAVLGKFHPPTHFPIP